jgi:hypothetical protein
MVVFIGMPEQSMDYYTKFYSEQQINDMMATITPMNIMFSAVIMFTFIGYFLSLIIAAFVKREKIDSNAE